MRSNTLVLLLSGNEVSVSITKVSNQIHLESSCAHTTILCFPFSTVFSKLHETSHTLKIDFVLYDFAQLQSNISVLSTFKMGKAKM